MGEALTEIFQGNTQRFLWVAKMIEQAWRSYGNRDNHTLRIQHHRTVAKDGEV